MAFIAKFVQDGDAIDYTPGADVVSGAVVVLNTLIGISRRPIPANTLGSLAVKGVFEFPKAAGGGTAFTLGIKAYWDVGNQRATITAGANPVLGHAVAAAADADVLVRIRLSQ